MIRHVREWTIATALVVGLLAGGCDGPAALELLGVARQAVAQARTELRADHDERVALVKFQCRSLDTAFDADVRLVAAGGIVSADGKPVMLSPEWVISARQGYGAAREALVDQLLAMEANHAARQDNLLAADEAIDRAGRLMLQWSLLSDSVQNMLIHAQEESIDVE